MTNSRFAIALLSLSFAYPLAALAHQMTNDAYQNASTRIDDTYKFDKVKCASFADNAHAICMAMANGKKQVAKAELDAVNDPSVKADYAVSVSKADASHAVASAQCDDKAGNVKDVCNKEADATLVNAKSAAEAQLKSSQANSKADQESADAQAQAAQTGSKARQDAAADTRDADYAVAKQKCEALAGDAETMCLSNAKLRYGE